MRGRTLEVRVPAQGRGKNALENHDIAAAGAVVAQAPPAAQSRKSAPHSGSDSASARARRAPDDPALQRLDSALTVQRLRTEILLGISSDFERVHAALVHVLEGVAGVRRAFCLGVVARAV